MTTRAIYLATIAFFAIGCSNNVQQPAQVQDTPPADTAKHIVEVTPPPPPPDIKKERAIQNHFLKSLETPAQHLTAAARIPSEVTGTLGTVVKVVPTDMVFEDGQPVITDIDVELKELAGAEDFALNNAPTVSDGRLLESGGAYYVNMTSGGRQLKLKLNKTLQVSFPKKSDKAMTLFYGEKEASGKINWKPSEQKFEGWATIVAGDVGDTSLEALRARMPKSGTMSIRKFRKMKSLTDLGDTTTTEEEKQMDRLEASKAGLYQEMKLQQFGWVNCDRFYDQPTTSFAFHIDSKDSIICATSYLVFKEINSVLQGNYVLGHTGHFEGIPVNAQASLIVVAVKDGNVYASKTDVQIGAQKSVVVSLQPSSDYEVKNLFKKGSGT